MSGFQTILTITRFGVPLLPLYSSRGLTQTLSLIGDDALRRSINGKKLDWSYPQFRLYTTTITCTDVRVPCIDKMWKGTVVAIGCVAELCAITTEGLQRTAVPGSERIEGAFTFYRPLMDMMITEIQSQKAEYPGDVQWSITAEEVEGYY